MKNILVAPLNWGLGHAARCIPLIYALEKMGASVVLASDGVALQLLKAEFPHVPVVELPSYRIRYKSHNMIQNIALQLPGILWAIRAEQWATEKIVQDYGIDGVVSDNRYGCFSKKVQSAILTHQLQLQIPNRPLKWCVNRLLHVALGKFDNVWVPDVAGEVNMSGALSHTPASDGMPSHPEVHFMGILSRMRSYEKEPEYDVAVVLSGPEPQRSILEQKLMEQALTLPQKFVFVQGKTQSKQHYFISDHVEVISFLTSKDLNDVLLASQLIVCRSGYSSLMDLAVLEKKALLIPTPGQTEQEYLANRLSASGYFATQMQDQVNLESGLAQAMLCSGIPSSTFSGSTRAFLPVLENWLSKVAG